MLRLCALMNNLMYGLNADADESTHHQILAQLCGPQSLLYPRLRPLLSTRWVLHRQQFLIVAKEALLHCSQGGKDPSPGDDLLRVFLMANDQSHQSQGPMSDPQREQLRIISEFLPLMESSRFYPFVHKLVRPYLLLTHVCRETDPFDLRLLFEQSTGVPLEVYFALVYARSVVKAQDFNFRNFVRHPESFGLSTRWFQTTTVPPNQLDAFLADVSGSVEELAGLAKHFDRGITDFTVFKERPMYRDGNNFYPIDLSFLAEKCESGLFWRVHNHLRPDERPQFHSYWGELFQRYVNWLLTNAVDQRRNRFTASPHYADRGGDEVCDGIVLCGNGAVLLEYKGSTFTAQAKYDGDVDLLKEEIDRKLIRPRGVGQLSRAATRLFGKTPQQMKELNISFTPRVFPLLVVRDDIGGALMLNAYLNEHFEATLHRKELSTSIAPLVCISADHLESVTGFLKTKRLTDIIEARYAADRELKSTFLLVRNRILGQNARGLPPVIRYGLDELMNLAIRLIRPPD